MTRAGQDEHVACPAELPPGRWPCDLPMGHAGKHFSQSQAEYWDEHDLEQERAANERMEHARSSMGYVDPYPWQGHD